MHVVFLLHMKALSDPALRVKPGWNTSKYKVTSHLEVDHCLSILVQDNLQDVEQGDKPVVWTMCALQHRTTQV